MVGMGTDFVDLQWGWGDGLSLGSVGIGMNSESHAKLPRLL